MPETVISFDGKTTDLLTYLRIRYGLKSKGEVLRKAIALLSLAMLAEQQDCKLFVVGADFEKEIITR